MSFLKSGTLCITVGGSGENAGRIVVVLYYTGGHLFDPRVTRGYRIRTMSGRPFASIREHFGSEYCTVRNLHSECTADRSNLRPLVDPEVEAEERDTYASRSYKDLTPEKRSAALRKAVERHQRQQRDLGAGQLHFVVEGEFARAYFAQTGRNTMICIASIPRTEPDAMARCKAQAREKVDRIFLRVMGERPTWREG